MSKKGFTLIEIIVALIIVSILAAVAIPNYITMMMQGEGKAAQNNLITIFEGEKSYYFSNGNYCTAICGSRPNINTNLGLNITDNYFNYSCFYSGAVCVATNISDPTFQLEIDLTQPLVIK